MHWIFSTLSFYWWVRLNFLFSISSVLRDFLGIFFLGIIPGCFFFFYFFSHCCYSCFPRFLIRSVSIINAVKIRQMNIRFQQPIHSSFNSLRYLCPSKVYCNAACISPLLLLKLCNFGATGSLASHWVAIGLLFICPQGGWGCIRAWQGWEDARPWVGTHLPSVRLQPKELSQYEGRCSHALHPPAAEADPTHPLISPFLLLGSCLSRLLLIHIQASDLFLNNSCTFRC